jgi:hypothetical protein
MYQYMFVENKKKSKAAINYNEEGEIEGQKPGLPTSTGAKINPDVRYISALNTRRNPDLLLPGGKFLKGN